ncbi:membrane dipeptidase [Clostridium fermenticellae]|uniref:Membrane dipeptidase n=1 Tax=Clostridium fermenticellae TaxID=2068654 RepID=A0A386H5W7_9CLOT|nr:dipeptidase [Clostridium fermenticellae]AYD41046.1 membrane dipeptidase [Clostridium fermenticellae]
MVLKVFDGHSDIFTDVTIKRSAGDKDIIKKYHLDRLKKGGVQASILGIWIDPPYTDQDPTSRMLQIMGYVAEEIEDLKEYGGIVYSYDDFSKLKDQNKLAILIGMEGISGFKDNANFINAMYKFGVRHAMLTWNEENEFATGVLSPNKNRGLTKLGVEVVNRMESLGMIVDVSHANEKTFWDIYENTTKPFIASHSNAYSVCNAARNLKDDQIKAIGERGGVIGMNAWPDFIDKDKPSAEKLADHIDYIANLIGIDHIGFGFDFCDFLESSTTSSFEESGTVLTPGLEDASRIPNLLDILSKRGYKDCDLEKIAYKNMERIIKEIVK